MGEPYEVLIKTSADTAGADETKAALAGVGDEAVAIDERQAGLAAQKQALTVAQLKALQAEALGETEVAAQLQKEVSLRQLALRLQEQSNISEAEAVAIAAARSVEEDKVYGKAGKFKLLQNVGVDSSMAKTLGIGALAAFQLQGYIEEAAKYYDELRITGEKESLELQKQVQSWKEMAASAKDLNDVAKLNESASKSIAEQYDKLKTLPSEGTKGFFLNVYDACALFDTELRKLIGDTKQFGTSTEEAAEKQKELINSLETARRVSTESATKNAEAIRALLALPYAEAVAKARDEIHKLADEQESLNRSDRKQEESWQRKQAQIGQLSAAISQLAAEHTLLGRKEELETQIALSSDPAKRAALQKELQDLQLQVLIRQKIKDASDLAAAAGKGWTDAESKAIEQEIKGPLEAKLKILRELASINPTGGYQKQIDKLLEVKPASATDSAKLFYEKIVADAKSTVAEIQNAKANLELILQQELRDLAKTTDAPKAPPPGREKLPTGLKPYGDAEAISQGVDEIGKQVADGADKLKASIDASIAQIKPAFDPVAEAMNQIPAAVTEGAAQIVSTVGSLATSMRSELSKLDADLQRQIDQLWSAL